MLFKLGSFCQGMGVEDKKCAKKNITYYVDLVDHWIFWPQGSLAEKSLHLNKVLNLNYRAFLG